MAEKAMSASGRLRTGTTAELAMIARAAGVPAPGSGAVAREGCEPSHRPGDPEDFASTAICKTVVEAAVVDARDQLALGAALDGMLRVGTVDFLVELRRRDLSLFDAAAAIGAYRAAKVMAEVVSGSGVAGGGR
jgi:hypothetical protein